MGIKNFLKGMGNVLQIFPKQTELEDLFPYYSSNLTSEQQDGQAIADDWEKVGQDIYKAIEYCRDYYII